MKNSPPQINLGDLVRLRKVHPCGGTLWRISRVGVDIGLVCLTCNRKILLPRSKFNKQFKQFEQPAENQ